MNEEIGVGPHPKPWPKDSRFDEELLLNGDHRNVLDKYRYMTVAAIKEDLDKNRAKLHVAIENWQHDLNIGTIVRTANAFNVDTVHVIGKRHWNRRGAMVTDRYMNIIHHDTVDDFAASVREQGYRIIGMDIIKDAKNMSGYNFPNHAVLVFGSEGPGLSKEMQQVCDDVVMIEQFGSTRSVNVGVAAGIAMYQWIKQFVLVDENVKL